jgi:outer membrane receptor protein involved in Fe transport
LYKHFVNDNFFFEFKATRYYTDWHEDSLNVDRSNESQADAYSTEIQATYITGENNTLIFGAVANNDYVSSNLFGRHSGYGGAFYFQDEYKFTDKIKANLGLRFDYQEVAGIASNQQWNPKFGLLYQAEENTTIRATVGRGFRAPSIAELFVATNVSTSSVAIIPSTDLKTEHSWSYEIGCIRNLADNIVIDASVFRGDFSDLIEAGVEYDTTRKSPIIRFRNVTEARIQGFEISVRTSFLRQILSIDLNYMYTWPYDLKKKSVLKFRPRHIASINAVATHKKFSFGSDFRFISKVDAIDDDLVRLAPIKDGEQRVPIYIIDVRASYDFSNFIMPIRVNFQINNILRYSYVELIGNMAPMRTFLLGIEGAF